jgi:hypothetical protein
MSSNWRVRYLPLPRYRASGSGPPSRASSPYGGKASEEVRGRGVSHDIVGDCRY